ncbi:hypothetical protein TW75_11810 [Pseudoalteromonas piscicida]|nr:hypothetical protein TW75_11810 [Pseudoalteromonas piscicida]
MDSAALMTNNYGCLYNPSDFTSIKKRIDHARQGKQPKSLLRFAGSPRKHIPKGLPFEQYSQLIVEPLKNDGAQI